MFGDLRELYQETILDHGKNPRNFRRPEDCNREAVGSNPVCGDALVVYLTVDDAGIVRDCAFKGQGCAISMASASMMTQIVRGKSESRARALFAAFRALATGEGEVDLTGLTEDEVDSLNALAGVRQFPVRVKCATLAWHTMTSAMDRRESTTTE